MTDDELDARFRALAVREPPAALSAAVLASVERARREEAPPPRPRWRPWAATLSALGAAAALAWVVTPGPPVGDPARLVARGVDEARAGVALQVAVRTADDALARHAEGTPYEVGSVLVFRVLLDAPAEVRLTRDGAPVWSGPLPAGAHDLPVAWSLGAGEGAATFAVEAHTEGGPATASVRVEAPR